MNNLENNKGLDSPLFDDINSQDCETKRVYIASNQDKRLLVVLCIGLKNNHEQPLLDSNSDAWNAQPIDVRKPLRVEHYLSEVKRRGDLLDVQPRPKPGQWNTEKMTAWLMERPIQNPSCIEFLSAEVARVTAIFEESLRVKRSEKSGPTGLWTKNQPWLRLLHCILDDDIRHHYLHCDCVPDRPALDAGCLQKNCLKVA